MRPDSLPVDDVPLEKRGWLGELGKGALGALITPIIGVVFSGLVIVWLLVLWVLPNGRSL
jgi:hypothetical protein